MDNTHMHAELQGTGSVRISDDVIAIIAGLAASEVDGVAGMSGSGIGSVAEMLGKKNLAKGVKVQVGDKQAVIDAYIIVEHGAKIPQVAEAVQANVRQTVESMTGLEVVEVNVFIQGVHFVDPRAEEMRQKNE